MMGFGHKAEWTAFEERHPEWPEVFERLQQVRDDILGSIQQGSPQDIVILAMSHMAVDDFMEILLLCGNGEGFAAQKLVRSMFERVVTLKYLAKHPDRIEDFAAYYAVERRKLLVAVQQVYDEGTFAGELCSEVEAEYQAIKDKYTVTACKTCGEERPALSWSGPLDLVSMARDIDLTEVVPFCYVLPLRQAHPTPSGFATRLFQEERSGVMSWTTKPRLDRRQADLALSSAHLLFLHALQCAAQYFKIDVEADALGEDYERMWTSSASTAPADSPGRA